MKDEKCPICQGTGFRDGKLCVCITGEGLDAFNFLKDLLGMTDKKVDDEKKK